MYEQLVRQGIVEADGRGSAVDHVTARRMALWLLPLSQQDPDFMRGLVHFAKTGAVTRDLKNRLRYRARTPSHSNRAYAARLLQYAVARGTDLGPVGSDFGGVCDQIDRADIMLIGLRDHVRNSQASLNPAPPDASTQGLVAMARYEPSSQTVSFILDAATANTAIHAISVSAADREASACEIRQYSQRLPEDSYGRINRENIAARESHITARLRAVERAYRTIFDPDATPALDVSQILRSQDRTLAHDLELE